MARNRTAAAVSGGPTNPKSAAKATRAQTTVKVPPTAITYGVNLQRIPSTLDPLSANLPAAAATQLQALRLSATQKVYLGIKQIQDQLPQIIITLTNPTVPTPLMGQLLEPDGTPSSRVQIEFDPTQAGGQGPVVSVITGEDGSFVLTIPSNIAFPATGLTLSVRGADTPQPVPIVLQSGQVAANGYISNLKLTQYIAPLPVSIIASLTALFPPVASTPSTTAPGASTAAVPQVTIGEDGGCQLKFQTRYSVDTFPYSVFYRLVEPQLSISNAATSVPGNKTALSYFMPNYMDMSNATSNGAAPAAPATTPSYIDRIPVEQPISVDGFRDNIMGVDADGMIVASETVPMAGTLGLGYILILSQQWTLQGLALGDLVYSLPLAPGEQEQVAIFERVDTSQVTESETFTESEAQQQSAMSDTSTLATFNSAVSQVANGGSQFYTDSTNSSSAGGGGLGFAYGPIVIGGGGAASTVETTLTGNTSQWLSGQLNTAQNAAQQTHSAAENQASARRTAARTGMRMATASESESITTKTITNHNHTRALTMQYWEVLRLFGVTTAVEGVTLTCLVPLQVVRFLPPGQPLTLANTFAADVYVGSRQAVLTRYSALLKHIDVLEQAVPRVYEYGLTVLRQFASDPTADVAEFGGAAEEVINFNLQGSFLPCERIYVSAVTRRNTRVGPVQLTGTVAEITDNTYASQDDVLNALRSQRNGGYVPLAGSLALPLTMNRNDIVGFEISRTFFQFDYTLVPPDVQKLNSINQLFPGLTSWQDSAIQAAMGEPANTLAPTTIHLMPSDLESAFGGPNVASFLAQIDDPSASSPPPASETYASLSLGGVQLPPQPYPVPAQQLAPLLQYNGVLEIEKTAQHVVRNTVNYSKAVWMSMTPEERAILLEGYTIGVPPGGVTDWTEMIPLLNCVENRVLGYFGNSMIMPFMIPPIASQTTTNGDNPAPVAITSGQVQDALMSFYKKAFVPPQSTIALPTKGVLGEAVLGHCPSAEKIDITRFWNWADSPADSAPAIASPVLPTTTGSIATGLTAPNSLTNLPPLINNVLSAPTPDTSLLQALAKTASGATALVPALSGSAELAGLITNSQNTAASARADALKTTQALSSLAMATAANLVGGQQSTSNPNAGSSALTALNGGNAAGQTTAAKSGVAVTVSPATATVAHGATQQFTAAVTGSSTDTSVKWTVASGGGTITAAGLYTAPAAAGGPFTVTATSVADTTKTGTAKVTVT